MTRNRLSRFFLGTLRGRLIISVAAVHALMMALFIGDLTVRQSAMLMDRQIEDATALSQALATSAAGWIVADDIAGLQELVESQRRYPEFLFAILVDREGRVLADTEKARQGLYMRDLPGDARLTVLSRTPALVDVATPALVGGRHVGWARVGIGQKTASEKLAQLIRSGVAYALAAILIGSVIAWLMGRQVTRRLYAVQETIDAVRSGNRYARSSLAGDDEAAVMAREFNAMLDGLVERDAELRASDEKYRSLIRRVQTAIVLHDGQGRILISNPMAHALLGLSEDQLLGKSLVDPEWHFLREDGSVLPIAEYPVSRVLSTGQALRGQMTGVCRPDRKDVAWVLVDAEPEFNDAGDITLIVVSFVDITERTLTEAALTQLAAIVESSRDAIIGKTSDGIITSWNRGAECIYGYSANEIIGKHITTLAPSSRHAEINGFLEKVREGGTVVNHESERFHKNGALIEVALTLSPIRDASGNLSGISTIARDITERKLNEAVNASRSHLLQFSLTHSLDDLLEETLNETEKLTGSVIGFYHLVEDDQVSLTLQNWSKSTKDVFCKAKGKGMHYPLDEAGVWVDCVRQGKAVIHNDYASLPNRKGMPEGHATVIRELVVPVFRGQKISAILGVGNKPFDYTEKDVATVSLFADLAFEIAERKKAEENINILNRDLEQRVADRTAQLAAANKELEAYSYSVSHDLRAPLRHIDGFLSLLKERTGTTLDDKSRHYMDTISDSAKRMGTLIDDLLAFSRMGRSEMAAVNVDLGALVQEIILELEPETKGRDIAWRIAELPVVVGDRAMLRVALVNLISNALKFTQKRPQAEIEIGCLPGRETEASVFVRDNGAGFDMKYVDKLFGVFRRLHGVDEFEGTGIGLANVRRIISRHGGRTWAEGKVDGGATFFFSLQQARQAK